VLAQLLLLDPVLVQCRHEVRQRSSHAKCDFLESKYNFRFNQNSLIFPKIY
jgi:hypothetical protein